MMNMKNEQQIENEFIKKLIDLKYVYREDIRDKFSLEENFRKHFERLNRVKLSDSEFIRLRDSIINSDVFENAKKLREINTFKRDDDTPLQYTLVNLKNWCKNEFEVVNQLRINTENSNHRYDVILLINGIPVVQIELKTLQITPKKAMEQIVNYKNDPGNGYTNSLLCFIQLFIVSNETNTYYFANNRKEHFSFNADERFLPIYEFADKNNNKITNLYESVSLSGVIRPAETASSMPVLLPEVAQPPKAAASASAAAASARLRKSGEAGMAFMTEAPSDEIG